MPIVAQTSTTETSLSAADDSHPQPLWPHWITTTAQALGIDPVHVAAIYKAGQDEREEHYDSLHQAASRVTEATARDLLRRRPVRRRRQDDLDAEAAELWRRVHPELVAS